MCAGCGSGSGGGRLSWRLSPGVVGWEAGSMRRAALPEFAGKRVRMTGFPESDCVILLWFATLIAS